MSERDIASLYWRESVNYLGARRLFVQPGDGPPPKPPREKRLKRIRRDKR